MYWHLVWPFLVGYAFSAGIGHALVRPLMWSLWQGISREFPAESDLRIRHEPLIMMVGVLERILYSAAWQFGKGEFIAVWLALKVAGQWKSWTGDHSGRNIGRTLLNLFLIGNGFSIAYGVVGAVMGSPGRGARRRGDKRNKSAGDSSGGCGMCGPALTACSANWDLPQDVEGSQPDLLSAVETIVIDAITNWQRARGGETAQAGGVDG